MRNICYWVQNFLLNFDKSFEFIFCLNLLFGRNENTRNICYTFWRRISLNYWASVIRWIIYSVFSFNVSYFIWDCPLICFYHVVSVFVKSCDLRLESRNRQNIDSVSPSIWHYRSFNLVRNFRSNFSWKKIHVIFTLLGYVLHYVFFWFNKFWRFLR